MAISIPYSLSFFFFPFSFFFFFLLDFRISYTILLANRPFLFPLCYFVMLFSTRKKLNSQFLDQAPNKGLKLQNTTHLEWTLSQMINSIQVRNGMVYFFPDLKSRSKEPETYIVGQAIRGTPFPEFVIYKLQGKTQIQYLGAVTQFPFLRL